MNGSARHIAKRVEALKEKAAQECIDTPHDGFAVIVRDLASEVELLAKLMREHQP